MSGQNVFNTRSAALEWKIGAGNVSGLTTRWTYEAGGNISTTPTVVGHDLYVPDWGGNMSALDARTGKVKWSYPVSRYSGIPGDISRTSPAYADGQLFFGQGVQNPAPANPTGAYMMSARAADGAPVWKTQIDSDPAAIVTQSPTVHRGVVYVGVSSRAEGEQGDITFRGSLLALDAKTGKILWKRYTVPGPGSGYSGAAVWGSSPVVDARRGQVYIATGNNETVPDGVCEMPEQKDCEPVAADDYVDAIVALDMRTGRVKWAKKTLDSDAWTHFHKRGPDYDFGAGPQLFTTYRNGRRVQLVGAGQKSGVYWALDPDTGKEVWVTEAGPGATPGGIMWGTATDGRRVYMTQFNGNNEPVEAQTLDGEPVTTTHGFWTALDAATGKVLWRTADPKPVGDQGFVTVANGVVYTGSMSADGQNMYALDARTGKRLWSYASGGSVVAGAAVVNGTVYWGSGYRGGPNNKLFAFELPRGGRNSH